MQELGNKSAGWSLAHSFVADIRIPAVLLSLLVSAWIAYSTDIVNGDAVLYITTAQHIDAGNWGDACRSPSSRCWLLYPALIALVGKVTSLGLEDAAYILNALLSALMVLAFLSLIRSLGADRMTLVVAAFVILFHPYLNDNKADIIRDHGYWAFYLVTMYLFVRYWHRLNWKNALAWVLSAIIATLFRIEGVVFLMLLPLVLLLHPDGHFRRRAMYLFKACAIPMLLGLGLFGWWLIDPELSAKRTGRLFEPVQRLVGVLEHFGADLGINERRMGEQVPGDDADNRSLIVMWVTPALAVASRVVNTLTPLYTVLPIFRQLRTRFNPPVGMTAVLVWLVILNLTILLVQILSPYRLSGRYIVPLAITVMLLVPFALVGLYDMWLKRSTLTWKIKWIFPVVLASLLFMAVDSVYSTKKGDKAYLREAGVWLRGRIEAGEMVYADDLRLFYYTGQKLDRYNFPRRSKTVALLKNDKWRQYDHVALITEKDDEELLSMATDVIGVPAHEFRNDRRSGVVIFSNKQLDHEVETGTVNVP